MTNPYLTLFEGLTYVFSSYHAPRFSSYIDYVNSGGMRALVNHYERRADIYGTDENILQETLSELAYVFLDDDQTENALDIYFNLTKLIPESAMAFSGLSEVYKSMTRYQQSIKAHQEAVNLSSKLSSGWQRFKKSRLEQVEMIAQ